jgi:hypothetical protein
MAESLIVRKGGGGAKIDEIIEQFTVAAGQTITAGKFVDYINTGSFNQGNATIYHSATVTEQYAAVSLSEKRVLVVYKTSNPTAAGTAKVLQISGTTITSGDAFVFNNANTSEFSLATLDSTRVVVAYRNSGDSNHGTAKVLSISGLTITAPSAAFVFSSANTYFISPKTLDSTRVFVAYRNEGTNGEGRARVLSISGTTITAPTASFLFSASTIVNLSIVALDAFRVFLAYGASNVSGRGIITILNVSGTTISGTNTSLFTTGSLAYTSVTKIDSGKVVICYRDNGLDSHGFARAVSILGSSGAIFTQGATFTFQSSAVDYVNSNAYYISPNLIENSKIIVSYTSSNTAVTRILNVSGLTITAYTNSFVFNNETTAFNHPIIITNNSRVLFLYSNQSNYHLSAKVLEEAKQIVNNTNEKPFGLAKTNGTAGQTVDVFVSE